MASRPVELEMRDLDDYAELPEPPPQYVPTGLADPYLGGLERYIFALGDYVRKIQEEEAQVMNQFSTRLSKLKGRPANTRLEAEDEARQAFENDISRIRTQRRLFRQMKQDALRERQRLLDSIALQRRDDELLRAKLFRIKALPDDEAFESAAKPAFFEPLSFVLGLLQIMLILVFAFVADYPDYNYPSPASASSGSTPTTVPAFSSVPLTTAPSAASAVIQQSAASVTNLAQGFRGYTLRVDDWYSFYVAMALMVFLGFGLLSSYLKKFAFSSIGYNLMLGAICVQWTILNDGLWWNVDRFARNPDGSYQGFVRIRLTVDVLINGLYGATTMLVCMGVLNGLCRPLELILIALSVSSLHSFNKYLCLQALGAVDLGGAMTIHLFGAYFGLAASLFISRPFIYALKHEFKRCMPEELSSSYYSDIISLLGSIMIFIFMPSFNAALAPNGTQYRVIINSILSLISGCVVVFIISRTFRRGMFDVRDVQQCVIAAGVAIASLHSALIQPGAAMLVGAVAAAVSVIGFVWLQPWLEQRRKSSSSPLLSLIDTRGAHNVHGLPGLIGGVASVVAASVAAQEVYGQSLSSIISRVSNPGGVQAAALAISLGIALLSGFVVGMVIWSARVLLPITNNNWYSDEDEWIVPADFPRKPEPLPTAETDASLIQADE